MYEQQVDDAGLLYQGKDRRKPPSFTKRMTEVVVASVLASIIGSAATMYVGLEVLKQRVGGIETRVDQAVTDIRDIRNFLLQRGNTGKDN